MKKLFRKLFGRRSAIEAAPKLTEGDIYAMDLIVGGQASALAAVEQNRQRDLAVSMLTIACLLTAAGGPVTISKDLIEAVKFSRLKVDVLEEEDGGITLHLVEPEPEPEFDPDQECDASC